MVNTGMLISRSCTTGWSDWVHGELWLTDSALIRSRLSLLRQSRSYVRGGKSATVGNPTKAVALPTRLDSEQLRAGHRTNRFISLTDIAAAELHRGGLSDRLTVRLRGGGHYKLLWLSADPAFEVLRYALPDLLKDRFTID